MTTPMREPTLGEVALTLARMESEFLRRFDEMRADIRQAVQAEVYEAQRQALVEQIAAAQAEIEEVRAEARRDVGALQAALNTEKSERRADRRTQISAAVAAFVAILVAAASIVSQVMTGGS